MVYISHVDEDMDRYSVVELPCGIPATIVGGSDLYPRTTAWICVVKPIKVPDNIKSNHLGMSTVCLCSSLLMLENS